MRVAALYWQGADSSFRVGCGTVSRREVGLILTAMGAASGLFQEPEVRRSEAAVATLAAMSTPSESLSMKCLPQADIRQCEVHCANQLTAGQGYSFATQDRALDYPADEEIIYRDLECAPQHRYSISRDFAYDLAHMQNVIVEKRNAPRNLNNKQAVWTKNILLYVAMAAAPIFLFVLMMLAAHRK